MAQPEASSILLRIVAPLLIWFAHISVLYAAATLLCPTREGAFLITTTIATVFVLVLLTYLIASTSTAARRSTVFIKMLTLSLTALAFLGVLWTSAPVMLLECR